MTVQELERRLSLYLDAEAAVLRGQEYEIGDRRLRRADLAEIRKTIDDLQIQIDSMQLKTGRTKRVVFTDD